MIEVFDIPSVRERVTASPGTLSSERMIDAPGIETGLVLFRIEPSPNGKQIVHPDRTVLVYVLEGSGRIRSLDEEIDVRAGSLVRIPPSTPHDFWASTEPLLMLYALVATPAEGHLA